jgi:DNA-binding FadR family transcriptional regulator
VEDILSGRVPAGTVLPSETELGARLGVSRPALREVLQYLAARGFVRPRKRIGTIVLDRGNWDLLDPFVIRTALDYIGDGAFLRELFEARRLIEPEAAALAASRASAGEVALIERAYEAMVAAERRDVVEWNAADLEFHTAIFAAGHNWVMRQFVSAIQAALLASFELTNRHSQSHGRALEMHRVVLEAIRLQRPDAARDAMRSLLDVSAGEMEEAIAQLGREPKSDGLDAADPALVAAPAAASRATPEAAAARRSYRSGVRPRR